MKKQTPLVEENKKHAAFKRFSQMSAAGLAVISLSAFTDLSAKQLPANVEADFVKTQSLPVVNKAPGELFDLDSPYGDNYQNSYSNYYNYSNYSNAPYSNNYSNSCDIS